jgi:hypothetical protein
VQHISCDPTLESIHPSETKSQAAPLLHGCTITQPLATVGQPDQPWAHVKAHTNTGHPDICRWTQTTASTQGNSTSVPGTPSVWHTRLYQHRASAHQCLDPKKSLPKPEISLFLRKASPQWMGLQQHPTDSTSAGIPTSVVGPRHLQRATAHQCLDPRNTKTQHRASPLQWLGPIQQE